MGGAVAPSPVAASAPGDGGALPRRQCPPVPSLTIPSELLAGARAEGRTDWLARLPEVLADLGRRWGLALDEPFQPGGWTAWVAPGSDRTGREVVLKVIWSHDEAEFEAAGLEAWNGGGVVRLFEAASGSDWNALLLERCRPGTLLRERSEAEQDLVIGGLLRRLWIEPPAGAPFRPLAAMCAAWADESAGFLGRPAGQLDEKMARHGLDLLRTLPESAPLVRLVSTDTHAGNVVAAEREPWLVIDPKPHVGDPHFDLVQHLLNCPSRLAAAPLALISRMAAITGLDAGRVRAWTFARCVQESLLPHGEGHSFGEGWLVEVTRRIAP